MAKGRFISKEISLDEKVDSLSNDTARLLFTWMIPHLDVEGRIYGDPQVFRSIVAPRRNYSNNTIAKYLAEFESKSLIERYTIDGHAYISVSNFSKHQLGLRKDKESQSRIPPKTPDLVRSKDGSTPTQVEVEVKDKVKDEDVGGTRTDSNGLLPEIQKLSGWGNSHLKEDTEWFNEFLSEFPLLSSPMVRACRDYHSGKAKHTTPIWKTRLRNWMTKDAEIKRSNNKTKKVDKDGWPLW